LLVRAADLASATAIQRKIQAWAAKAEGLPERFPAVLNTALVVQNDGHRLEKRTAGVTLKELKAAGWSVESILKRFESSFDLEAHSSRLHAQVQAGRILGESETSLTLRELGF
jgi:glutamyl/glutaminyl-tRNA synthetase